MSKHTPGPWYLRQSDNATVFIEHSDCHLDAVGNIDNRICVMPVEITSKHNSLNNARLIAASPDLLEALKEILYYIGDRKVATHGAMHRARAAIAKATGETE
jgi:hypothetical protein